MEKVSGWGGRRLPRPNGPNGEDENQMILTVDIGNSNITMGVYRENDLLFVARLATDRSRTGDQYAVELKSILRFMMWCRKILKARSLAPLCRS